MEDSGTPWLMFLLYAFYLVIPLVSIPIVMWTQARGENSASCASRKFCCRNISKVTYVYTWIYLATAIFSVTPIGMEWEDGVYQMGTIYIISYVLAPACWFLGIMEYCLSSDTAYLHNLGDLAYLVFSHQYMFLEMEEAEPNVMIHVLILKVICFFVQNQNKM